MSGTGSPYDVKHLTHVSQELSWHVEDLQRLDVLGEGAYAEVYHVVHSGMHFAAKILASDLCDKELQNETEILRKCQHPNIVKFYGILEDTNRGSVWILMDLCRLGSVSSILDRERVGLSVPQVQWILYSVLRGLEYLHAENIRHNDVKPSNILIDSDGTVKIADFGISQKIREVAVVQLKKRRNFGNKLMLGTPYYLAPETITNQETGFASDIWSLGISTIEMLDAENPYSDMGLQAFLAIPGNVSPKPITPIPEELEDLISKMLIKDPVKRLTAKELLKHPFLTGASQECLTSLIRRATVVLEKPREKNFSLGLLRKSLFPTLTAGSRDLGSASSRDYVAGATLDHRACCSLSSCSIS